MNFLAHIYLSGNDEFVKIGNFIADGIRGKKYLNYSKNIQIGILLHRAIDSYTDAHPTFKKSTKRLHKPYGHYSGVIVDILYDHFLAKNWTTYSNTPLADYITDFYASLTTNFDILPLHTQKLLPHMIADNWLLSYASINGIERVLEGMNRRTKYKSNMNLAVNELVEFYDDFEEEFTTFIKAVSTFSEEKLHELSLK